MAMWHTSWCCLLVCMFCQALLILLKNVDQLNQKVILAEIWTDIDHTFIAGYQNSVVRILLPSTIQQLQSCTGRGLIAMYLACLKMFLITTVSTLAHCGKIVGVFRFCWHTSIVIAGMHTASACECPHHPRACPLVSVLFIYNAVREPDSTRLYLRFIHVTAVHSIVLSLRTNSTGSYGSSALAWWCCVGTSKLRIVFTGSGTGTYRYGTVARMGGRVRYVPAFQVVPYVPVRTA